MGECLLEENGLNRLDTDNEIEQRIQRKSIEHHKVSERAKWFEANISRTDRNTKNTDQSPPNRWTQTPSEEEGIWRTVHSYIRKGLVQISS